MSFTLDLSNFAENAIESTEDIIRSTAIELFTSIIMDTPVDTGRARGNWFATGVKTSVKVTSGVDTGENSVARMKAKISSLKDVDIVQLTNNLPYIKRLEDGYSTKAPAGMVKVNITRFEGLLTEEARKRKI